MVTGPGTYTVTVTNNGCTSTAQTTVTVTNITASMSGASTLCTGGSTTLTASGGGTYLWSNSPTIAVNVVTGPGTYTVTVTNNGCTSTAQTTITVTNITASISGATTMCTGGNATLTASGGGTYLWNNGPTTAVNIVNSSGTYSVTVTNSGCTSTAQTNLTITNITAGVSVTQPTCGQNNGSISVTPSTGSTYAWTGGLTGQNPLNVGPGTYTVTVTETVSGCTSSTSFTLNASTNITAGGSVTQPTCGQTNGSISVTPSTGSTYAWTGGLSGQNPLNVGPGTYTVTVTETASGCTSSTSFTVNASGNIAAGGSVTQPTCGQNNGSISVTPISGVTYAWTGGLSGQNPLNVGPGTYTVTVTETASGCTSSTSFTVNASTNITAGGSVTQPTCGQNNGSISVTPSTGVTYAWTGGLSGQNPLNVGPGTYTVTVTETVSGCTSSTSFTVNASTNITAGGSVTQPTCGQTNGSISVTPSTGSTYAWTGGLSGQNPLNVGPGTYTVTVTETASGCTSSTDFTINASTNITAGGNVTQPTCGQTNGSISVTPSTGSTYAWTGGLSGQNPLNVDQELIR
ncbi:MAG: hypothetical protein IPO14_07885 [Saprospiraceae bacterium]|nr:hypothetical protein [Saprospiraceae bacterium]